jgi:hypothetical protein
MKTIVVFRTIESCRVGIPAYYAKRRERYPVYLRKHGNSKLVILEQRAQRRFVPKYMLC